MQLDGKTLIAPPPFVEVDVTYEPGRAGAADEDWCALQIHTQNRVYDVDWGMRCFAVTDVDTGEPDPDNRLIGAILTGGQKRGEGGLELSFPVPRPGVAAVFEVGEPPKADYVTTSDVKRVVLRIRVLTVSDEVAAPSWKALTGAFRATRTGHSDPEAR